MSASGSLEPCTAGSSADLSDFVVLLLAPLLAGQLLELLDGCAELVADIGDFSVGYFVVRVKGDIDHDHGDIEFLRQVLIPLDHAVADIITTEKEIGLGHILLRRALNLGIGKADPCVRADVVGISVCFTDVAHALAGAAGRDTCRLVLGVNYCQAKGLGNFHGEVAGAPTYHFTAFLGSLCGRICFCCDLAKSCLR